MGTNNSKENEVIDEAINLAKEREIKERAIKETIDKEIKKQVKAQIGKHSDKVLRVTNYKSTCQEPQILAQECVGYADFNSTPVQESSHTEEKVLRKIIPGQDGRVRVNETREWPHSVHGLLSMKFDNLPIPYTGTATMIGPNIAITAAHNLYHFETQTEVKPSNVYFYPAANDHSLPFGAVRVQAFYYPEEYKITKKEDYALLILQYDIGEQTGYFGLHAIERRDIEGKMINITGYPADKVADKPKHHQMWGMEGPISHLDDDLISYQIDTYAGQSGSGIWYDAGGEYYIVGVHVLGSKNCLHNQGTFLNKKRVERIREWTLLFCLKLEHTQIFQSLDLDGKGIGEEGAEYLSKAKLPQLRTLYLPSNQIGEKGAEHLSKANFPQLRSLWLLNNQIGEIGAGYLSESNFPYLQALDLPENRIGDKGVESLSKAKFPQLQSLCLRYNQIGDKGAEYLSKANFPHLRSLDLWQNNIGDQGVKYLSKANFPQLQSLDLWGNLVGDKGAEYLSEANFPKLQSVNLSNNEIGDEGAEFLQFMISYHPNKSRLEVYY